VRKRIHVVHHSPGRIRVKVDGLKGSHAVAQKMHDVAETVEGVEQVKASRVTGSVVVQYDKTNPEVWDRIKTMLDDADRVVSLAVPEVEEVEIALDIAGNETSALADRFPALGRAVEVYNAVDAWIKAATSNAIDLKTLFPVVLAGCGVVFWDWKINPLLLIALLGVTLYSVATYRALEQASPER
jgi:hypothetical protein